MQFSKSSDLKVKWRIRGRKRKGKPAGRAYQLTWNLKIWAFIIAISFQRKRDELK